MEAKSRTKRLVEKGGSGLRLTTSVAPVAGVHLRISQLPLARAPTLIDRARQPCRVK
jgi:hypothetical protein